MSLAERLTADEVTITAWSGVPDALTVELLANQPFDAVTLDMQHGGHHEDSVLRSIVPVQKAGKPVLVRIPVGRFDMASRALDFGADGVIAPMINTVDDARRFAASMKYPPVGERSWGPTFGAPRYGKINQQEWLKKSNDRVLAFAMVETRAAFEALDDILAVPGIDGIFVGPSDFSIAWSDGAVVDSTLEEMMGTVAAIAERTREAGKFAAIYVMEPKIAGRVVGMGFRLLATGSEGQLFNHGAAALLGAINESIKG